MSPIINHLNHYYSTRHGEKEILVEVDLIVQVVDHFVSSPDLVDIDIIDIDLEISSL